MKSIEIQSPVKGEWSFMNPPGHHPDAKDFVAVNQNGKPYPSLKLLPHIFYKINVNHTYAWNQAVYSPFSGYIRFAKNNSNDRASLNIIRDIFKGLFLAKQNAHKGLEYFLGNYIIIESAFGVYALLAHLKKDSLRVKEGQKVVEGEIIAYVGNSGNTIQPHLHFQLMKDSDPTVAIPVPFTFKSYKIKEKGKWINASNGLPDNFQSFSI